MIRALRRWLRPGPAPEAAAPGLRLPPAEKCLFIVGAARSGSTVLQNALNDSPEIFLFGEANFHLQPTTPDFAARYNAMHRSWNNQETKSSFCPPVLRGDAPWNEYLCKVAMDHRLVGSKTVDSPGDDWFAFQCRHFFRSRYLFTFRDPLPTFFSTQELQRYTLGKADGAALVMRNYLAMVALYLRCLRVLPNVRAICHEDMNRIAFDRLEDWLGVKLPRSHEYYDAGRVNTYSEAALDDADRLQLAPISALYASLRQGVREGFALPQLDQNNAHLTGAHFTPLGQLSREVDRLMDKLTAETAAVTATSPSPAAG